MYNSMQLRKYLNDLLTDQLPVLKDLKWAVEQLVIQVPQTTAESASGRLIIEQVPELREKLMTGKNWREEQCNLENSHCYLS
ncbi:hypothetical protein KC19_4G265600 [Ceratodon purpureus]|uniref:Uncharacterized protein n=1 Tax=Ceratodon purpureus TaxID=3225 RepID=A0A8T0IDZ1_CERPU|nr:hypothetical protein KC19_4G265600 [Ceratodon purpureus]